LILVPSTPGRLGYLAAELMTALAGFASKLGQTACRFFIDHHKDYMIDPTKTIMMPNFLVLLEGAWLVRDVKTEDDAIGVAISEAGKRLNQRKMDFVEVETGQWDCPECGEPLPAVFLVANTALVALLFEIKIFNAESEEHAGRIAKSSIGKALGAIPLNVLETTLID
jgi:uncharacterized protein (UPF0212 family)